MEGKIPHEIFILVFAAFLVALGWGIVSPILPQLASSFNVSMAAVGFVVSVMSAARLVFAPPAGSLVNRLGSRRVYITGLLIVAVTTGAIAIVNAYWQILVLRALSGLGSTMFTVSALSLIVKLAPPDMRGRCSATYGTAFLIGNICGPLVGTVLAPLGMRIPFLIYAVTLFIAAAVVFLQLKDDSGGNNHNSADEKKVHNEQPLRISEVIHDRAYQASLMSSFAHGFTNLGVRVAILPLFAAYAFGHHGTALAGLALAAFAAGDALSLQISGRLSDRIGRRPLIVLGLISAGTFTAFLGLGHQVWVLLLVSACSGFGAGLLTPALQAAMADIVGQDRPAGTVMASQQMAQDLGAVLGPVLIGFIADQYGYSCAFITAGVVCYIGMILWPWSRETLVTRNH